ncbi:hypothetical protein [Kitasatospora sp. MBT63]|uniref:hypothetical protein n=1 Tax=Kitasatospora sp. MBT63 TaxID=1444768 RepID=UPI000691B4BD|nr:hypothetical protein [Kitasatospora sp. MBT63]
MAYATADQLRLWLRLDEAFTADEQEQAELLLDLAAGAIEDETGQPLEQADDVAVLDGSGTGKLILPRWPVTAIASVTLLDSGDVLTEGVQEDYTWSKAGILFRRCGRWPCEPQAVEVDYTAGYSPVPAGLQRIALRLAGDAWNNPARLASETLGDHARSWATPGEANMELSEADRRTLTQYKART